MATIDVLQTQHVRTILTSVQRGTPVSRAGADGLPKVALHPNMVITGLDVLAENGQLEELKWFTDHPSVSVVCTEAAMDRAAKNGHLEVLRFLHENRTEGCTTYAMDYAAGNGHLEVVRFLHENRSEGCTQDAMLCAVIFGHIGVVRFLYENRTESRSDDCMTEAITMASMYGQLKIEHFLEESFLQ